MQVAIIMGSKSDYPLVKEGEDLLKAFDVSYDVRILSAHRTPEALVEYVKSLKDNGVRVVIAVAGKAAALPGVVAAHTTLPVIGVPVETKLLGLDSLFSICQMPAGVPVATMGIGRSGMINAVLFAIQILAGEDPGLEQRLLAYREEMAQKVLLSEREIKP